MRGLEGRKAGSSSSSSCNGVVVACSGLVAVAEWRGLFPAATAASCCWYRRRAAADEFDLSPEEDERRLLFEERFRSGTRGEETDDFRRWGKDV